MALVPYFEPYFLDMGCLACYFCEIRIKDMNNRQLKILGLLGSYQYEYLETDTSDLKALKRAGLINVMESEFSKKPLHITLTKFGLVKLRQLKGL